MHGRMSMSPRSVVGQHDSIYTREGSGAGAPAAPERGKLSYEGISLSPCQLASLDTSGVRR